MNPADFTFVADLVRKNSAIVLDDNKVYLVKARLSSLCREQDFDDLASLVRALRANPNGKLSDQVVEAMTTNESSFFRDGHPFELLRTNVLPKVVEARASERKLDLWCAAASSGQEPYTIAMVLKETLPELSTWNVKILATDINEAVLEKAVSGVYSQLEINRGLPAAKLVKYFSRDGITWKVNDELRKMIDFRALNLIGNWPVMPQFDIIFIRNVLIYFDIETKKLIFERLRKLLRPNGFLFLGAAETTINIDDGFERLRAGKTSCYQVKAA